MSYSGDPNELMAVVRDGLSRPDRQDPVIGALEALGEMREQRAVPLFKQALGHTNNGTRTRAAVALYQCGDAEGINALLKWVSQVQTNPRGAVQAIHALGKIGNSDSTEALRRLQREHGSSTVMFQGDQRTISSIVDSLLGASVKSASPGSIGSAATQKASSGCLTLAIGVATIVVVGMCWFA